MNGDARDPVARAVADWLARYALTGPVVVGVSGGADSLALALAVHAAIGDRAVAVTVDHGLQDGSAERATATADQLQCKGYRRIERRPVVVGTAGGPEAAARTARLGALRGVADELGSGTPILLAHTMDDQAETVLLGLGRGSGPRSIAGMRAWRAPFGRPLLGVRRTDTEAACRAAGVEFWTDPHNSDPRFTRVRVRTEVLPLLEQVLGGGVAAALARTAALVDDDLRALDDQAAAAHAALRGSTPTVAGLIELPVALRQRMIRLWLQHHDVDDLAAHHYDRIDDLVRGTTPRARVRLPGALDLVVEDGALGLIPAPR